VLDAMKAGGLPFNGQPHKIDGYVAVDWTNKELVKAALYIFGNLTLGINLPGDWTRNAIWDVTNSGVVGGHDVTAVGYRADGVVISSWGKLYLITWAAFTSKRWLEEVWVLLGPDWYGSDKLAPSGVNLAALQADLAKVAAGQIPTVDPGPGPTPAPGGKVRVAISGWADLPSSAVGTVGTVTGSCRIVPPASTTHPDHTPINLHPSEIHWEWIPLHLMALMLAVSTRNIPAAIAAFGKLAKDFGIDPTPND
jgi:hypothetical protein